MNMVPLSPMTIVRAPGWPDDQTSALKPDGSLILSSGSLSTAVAIGGVGCGLRFSSCLQADGFDLSIWLKPGGPAGGDGVAVGGACWAESEPAAAIARTRLAASGNARRHDVATDMKSSLMRKPCVLAAPE